MKQLLLLGSLLFLGLEASADILRVNNTPGSNAPFNNFTDAHAFAQEGDTIYLEGSAIPYGVLTLTKRLVVIGPGYFLEENPDTPTGLSAITSTINLERTDSDNPFSGAAESVITGLDITEAGFSGIVIRVSDVIITKNSINSSITVNEVDVSGYQIKQNFCFGRGLTSPSFYPGLVNFTFSNNIVLGNFGIVGNSQGTINHNLFLGTTFDVESFGGQIRSNIATSSNTTNFFVSASGNGQISHNTAANGQFGNDNNNNVTIVDQLFEGPNENSTDGQYRLSPTALGVLNNAHDGTDRGPFGGDSPYCLSGVGGRPFIFFYDIPECGRPGEEFEITIRASAGN